MTITVNGNDVDYVDGETIAQLLKRMNFVFPLIVVKVDGQLVKKPAFGSTQFPDGASIQVIHLISGG